MRIVIDLQGAQTESRYRGIGRYSLALAVAMARQAAGHELFLTLNLAFPETIESIRERFRGLIPPEHVLVWRAPGPAAMADDAKRRHTLAGEMVRAHALSRLKPDIVHISSLFERGDAITSASRFRIGMPFAVTLYDLIPYLNPGPYFSDPVFKEWYLGKLSELRAADLLLAISEYSRAEAIQALGLAEDRLAVATADADPQFRKITLGADAEHALRRRHGLNRGFLMYTGGIENRKNVERLVEAFARLPRGVRAWRQLAIVGQTSEDERVRFAQLCRNLGLGGDEVVLTGFASDDDLVSLYNLCELFVFPSLHEGFGLPILEAMRCGAPVVGSDRTSIPEVIGRRDALFDPTSVESIAGKLVEVLINDAFRQNLREHGIVQARRFSWDASARRALGAFEVLYEDHRRHVRGQANITCGRPLLAYISPLPPERSGIADYSAELLPELLGHYRIEVITDLAGPGHPYLDANFPRRSIAYFETHVEEYERILYHFGNSRFHWYMFPLIMRFPGTVVLHDFYLSGVLEWLEATGPESKAFRRALYRSHGYGALRALKIEGVDAAVRTYPCNLDVLENAQGVIVHSRHARTLAERFYGRAEASDWAHVPQLRRLPAAPDRARARKNLSLPENAFIVASFGIIHAIKQNHRLLSVWLRSDLAQREDCHLLFVGPTLGVQYEQMLRREIEASDCRQRITLTGYVSPEDYQLYLQASNVAVQLRAHSYGETSRSVLDCLAHGLATVVNTVGAAAELPDDAVVKLSEEFGDDDLARALMRLAQDRAWRFALGERARDCIAKEHDPATVGRRFFDAIEYFAWAHPRAALRRLTCDLESANTKNRYSPKEVAGLALAIAETEQRLHPRQLFVDVSVIARDDFRTGIERVTRNILRILLENPPAGYRVEPVHCAGNGDHYRYARAFTQRFLDMQENGLEDAPIDIYPGDVFLGLDSNRDISAQAVAYLQTHSWRGLRVYFVVYDLLPIRYPQWFPPGTVSVFCEWLARLAGLAHGFACISQAVANDLADWVTASGNTRRLELGYFHLGADISEGRPDNELSQGEAALLTRLVGQEALLMVGTVEPRKGHAQVLDAMDILWAAGEDVSLVIVGKVGWMVEELVTRLRTHPQRGNRLFWFERASDGLLDRLYTHASALVMASGGEGFGLPLIEAAQHGLPIIARDIPVFREVAGNHAVYFAETSGEELAATLTAWLAAYREGDILDTTDMPHLTWTQSARQLVGGILEGKWGGGGEQPKSSEGMHVPDSSMRSGLSNA
ncbi:MAG TPA: glycosyltransferase [bacterium]|nr:glycosyltransferase [bacterium]